MTTNQNDNPETQPVNTPPNSVTWAGLLGSCMEFARSAVSLPESGEAGHYRRSVPAIISLYAVTHALGDIGRLQPDEIPLALDRADLLIEEAAAALLLIWGEAVPESLAPFVLDAVEALDRALAGALDASGGDQRSPGDALPVFVEWMVDVDSAEFPHPGDLALALASTGLRIDLHMSLPGAEMFRGAVAASADLTGAGEDAGEIAAAITEFLGDAVDGPFETPERRQVYRQFDFARGGPVRDVVAPASAGELPGQPLLVPVLRAGEVQPVPMPHRKHEPLGPIPVEVLEP